MTLIMNLQDSQQESEWYAINDQNNTEYDEGNKDD